MITRREMVRSSVSASVGALFAGARRRFLFLDASRAFSNLPDGDSDPPLAPGAPNSAQRLALIDPRYRVALLTNWQVKGKLQEEWRRGWDSSHRH